MDRLWYRRSLQGRGLVLLTALITVVLIGATSIVYSLDLQRRAIDQAAADRERLNRVEQFDAVLQSEDVAIKAYLRTGEPSFLDSVDSFRNQARAARSRIQSPAPGEVDARWADWTDWEIAARAGVVLGRTQPSASVSDSGDGLFELLSGATSADEEQIKHSVAIAAAAARGQEDRLLVTTIAASGFGLLMLLVIGWGLYRSTLVPVRRLVAAARALSAGDFAEIPEASAGGEIGQLARALAEWERASRERLTLAQAMVEVGTETDLDKVIASGSARLRELLDGTIVSVTVGGPATGYTSRISMPGTAWDRFGHEMYADGPTARAAEQRTPVATDLRAEAWPETVREYALGQGLGPALAVPLLSAGDLIGVACVVRTSDRRMFSVAEVQRAELVVQPLAVAIHVAALFDQLRRANTELGAASRHKSEFLATMSHELRTPLNSILGFSQLLESADFGELSERQRRYVDHIHSSGNHLLALINDVLDLSKVEAGQLELAIERVSLEDAVEQCLARMRPLADAKRLQLTAGDLSGLAVNADARRLQQVLLNLLSNAVKFTSEEGEVRIEATAAGGVIRISVTDTGVGIAPEDLERVFEQFIQLRTGRTRSQEGTGLGLALSRRLVDLMGGSIGVESQLGQGSVFSVRLPMAQTMVRTPSAMAVITR